LATLETLSDLQLGMADTNGDNVVDVKDAGHLQKYIAGYDVKLG
jgi:hypothetical protein